MTKANNSPSKSSYFLRCFTSASEFDLCDHTTLPTADILSKQFLQDSSFNELIFETRKAGELTVKKCYNEGRLQLDCPMNNRQPIELDNQISNEIKSKSNIA